MTLTRLTPKKMLWQVEYENEHHPVLKEVIRLLVKAGADLNDRFESYINFHEPATESKIKNSLSLALIYATDENIEHWQDVATLLLKAGADGHHYLKHMSALSIAVDKADKPKVELLLNYLQQGSPTDAPIATTLGEPLWTAVSQATAASREIAFLLLNAGAAVNAVGGNRGEHCSPIVLAIKNDDVEMAEQLLAHDARLDTCNYRHLTPLQIAHDEKKWAFIPLLLAVDPRGQDKNYLGHMLCDALFDNTPASNKAALALLDAEANPNVCHRRDDKIYFYALHLAVRNSDTEIIAKLLHLGACIDTKNHENLTPIAYAKSLSQASHLDAYYHAVEANQQFHQAVAAYLVLRHVFAQMQENIPHLAPELVPCVIKAGFPKADFTDFNTYLHCIEETIDTDEKAHSFRKIHKALYDAQGSWCMTNFLADKEYLSSANLLLLIQSHLKTNPTGRTAETWRLTQEHQKKCTPANDELVGSIYHWVNGGGLMSKLSLFGSIPTKVDISTVPELDPQKVAIVNALKGKGYLS